MKIKIGDLVAISDDKNFSNIEEIRFGILEEIYGSSFYLTGSMYGYKFCRKLSKTFTAGDVKP